MCLPLGAVWWVACTAQVSNSRLRPPEALRYYSNVVRKMIQTHK